MVCELLMHNSFEVILPNHELHEKKSHFVYHFGFLDLKNCNGLIKEIYNQKIIIRFNFKVYLIFAYMKLPQVTSKN